MYVGRDGAVGKTCLLTSYDCKKFPTDYVPRVYGGHAETVIVDDVPYGFGVFDITGDADSDYHRILYPQTDVILVCYNVCVPESFANVRDKWFPAAHHYCPGVPCVIVGTQIDLRDDVRAGDVEKTGRRRPPTITTAQGEKLARELKAAKYVECSAKTRKGVDVRRLSFPSLRVVAGGDC